MEIFLVHIGSNDLQYLKPPAYGLYINQLLCILLRANPEAKIVLTSVLPRPKDDHDTKELVCNYNWELKRFADQRIPPIHNAETVRPGFNVFYSALNKVMAGKNLIYQQYYAIDKLHPSYAGNCMLEAKLRNIFNLMSNNMLGSFLTHVPLVIYWNFTSHLLDNVGKFASVPYEEDSDTE